MEVISLFAGCGGLDLGFRRAGFRVVWANEFDKAIHETYRRNHPQTILNTSDIRTLDEDSIPNCDGIIGGPPCQSWSLGGKSLGLDDERGQLVYDYIRIVKAKQPKFFIMENVAGMVSPKHIKSFQGFLELFRNAGYRVKFELINAADFRIPQDRLRVFIVGIRKDIKSEYFFPVIKPRKAISLYKAIGDLKSPPRAYCTEKVIQKDEVIPNHDYYTGPFDAKFMARNRIRTWEEKSYTIQAQAKNEPLHPQAPKMKFINENQRCFVPGSENLYRRLSVRECARIQTFPDSFYFVYSDVRDGYKMVGNAVPPRLAEALAVSIRDCFSLLGTASCENILIGYIKSLDDLEIVRHSKVYYIRGGSRAGAMQYGQIEKPIKWLLLHQGNEKWLFELTEEKVVPGNKEYLKQLGFHPRGNEYWIFRVKQELDKANIIPLNIDESMLTPSPQIISIPSVKCFE